MIGRTISHYKILSKLGEGGMGVVYKAEDLTLGRTVALKFLPPDSIAREEDRARLVHEARAAAALLHPNICPVHEIAEAEGRTFIAMAYIEGRSLKDRINEGPLPLDEALSIARQIGDALAAAHAKGIIHRDIKPANVMLLLPDGHPMLMDFGLAKVSGATKLTRTGTTMGTVAYMSPEQVQGREVDQRSDIWALGVVLYEMVSGRVPFPGEYEAAIVYGIMNEDPQPLALEGSDIPAGLDGIIAKALAKDPAKRYQRAEELVADLDTLARDREALPAGRVVPARGLRRLWRRWRPWQRAAAVTSLVALAAIASVLLLRFWPSPPDTTKYSLAVMDFRDLATPDDPTVSAGLTELVNMGLIQAELVRVVSSDLLHDLRRRLFGSPRGVIEDSQTMEIARKAEATLFLVATIGQSGANRFVNWRLVDARNGQNVGGRRAEGGTDGDLADQIIAQAMPMIARACGVKAPSASTMVESITTTSHLAYQHFVAGILAAEEARPVESIAELKKAVAQDSTFALAYLWLARIYFGPVGFGQERQARECAEKAWALRTRLSTKDQLRLESLRYGLYGRAGDAIATLRTMMERWPDDRDTMAELEQRLFYYWYFADAADVGERGRLLYPDDIYLGGAAYLQALIYIGRVDESFRIGKSYVEQHPQEPKSWEQIAEIYLALGQPDSAEAMYSKARELDPTCAPGGLSRCAYHRGDLKGAIRDLEQVLENKALDQGVRRMLVTGNPINANLAMYCIEAGRVERARDLCGGSSPLLDMVVGRHLLAMGRAREVLDLAGRYLAGRLADQDTTRRTHQRAILLSGLAMAELGDFKGARAAGKEFLRAEMGGGAGRFQAQRILAEAALDEGNPKAALEYLAAMKRQGVPTGGYVDVDYRTDVARAYRMAGQLDEAVKTHTEMLRIYGGHALSHYELGTIYEEMKRPAEAKKEYTKFLEMWSEADEGLPQLVDARKRLAAL
jgi:tetratricopeptide (TPR) repeat protein/predicted Ser/Thr protein kinase